MRKLKTGDPCPCCGMPIKTEDPAILLLLSAMADVMGKPVPLRCGECPVAMDLGVFGGVLCPFSRQDDPDPLKSENEWCDLEVIGYREML